MKSLLAALLVVMSFASFAEEPAAPAPEVTPEPAAVFKPGEVYTIDDKGRPNKIDLNQFSIHPVQWFEFGLRSDGVVIWRKK